MFDILIPKKRIIVLDADGVLLDYNKAAARVWERAFGVYPALRDPKAYHFRNVYAMDLVDADVKSRYYAMFDRTGWRHMPAIDGAVEACQRLHGMGYELQVVSSMPEAFAGQRMDNLRDFGMPIEGVTATGRVKGAGNPKLKSLLQFMPVAFADDLLSNFEGVSDKMHCALIHWDSVDNPNEAHEHVLKSSTHTGMLDFAKYWEQHPLHQAGRTASEELQSDYDAEPGMAAA